jgi:hypothetical protein
VTPRAWPLALRGIAIAIAIAAVIDPAITSRRAERPTVAVVAASARDSSLALRVAAALEKRFIVVRAPFPGAAASVVVGDNLPANTRDLASHVFAVLADRSRPTVTLESVESPATSPATARVPVTATAHVTGARGRTLEISLRAAGLVVDRARRIVRSDDERVSLPLAFIPTAPGAARLRVAATLGGDSATTDALVDVRERRWAVLFFDARPSWMSTFVRRAIERDPRFVVTSRIVTSRNVSTDAGAPPARLDDLTALGLYDAVVIGAPEALADRDVSGLDAFLRRRGGSVVLLLDRRAAGPYERLSVVTAWTNDSTGKAEAIGAGATADSMRAAELLWPARLPEGADVVASTRAAVAHPVVWESHVGAGRLIVSGALDAWRYRDRSVSSFDRFWQTLIADAATAAPPPLAVGTTRRVVRPGETIGVDAMLRDAVFSTASPLRVSANASIRGQANTTPMRLWPGDRVGMLQGSLKAPATPGQYRLAVAANGARAEVPIIVASDESRPSPEAPDLVRAWVTSRGGVALAASEIGMLAPRLSGAIHAADRRMTWHPMRSAWWILPFALALSAEWWLRRRRGLV